MSKLSTFTEKAKNYDQVGTIKYEVNRSNGVLKELRQKYPFNENLRIIEWLDPDKLYKINPDEIGEFFQFIDDIFKALGYNTAGNQNIYRNARLQLSSFKNLLRTTVDDRKTLAEKVDVAWEKIGGMGSDRVLAKKIIYCFNGENQQVLPIVSNQHLRYFVNRIVDGGVGQTRYFSLGQEYAYYTSELLKAKSTSALTHAWDNMYFSRFLYENYTPPDTEPSGVTLGQRKNVNEVTDEQLSFQGFIKLLGELQRQGKLSGEQFRENRALWQNRPEERHNLTLRLKKLLEP
ncbi:MAG: hypothetical protein NWF01_03660 [Candidatus Bathyarchaeota archaeon]|nr:hypothetical protein [Candidatus Bathyarchaeota archaeon]